VAGLGRYLCSQLATLRCGQTARTVNLEEIWESGAVLECEEAPAADAQAELRCGAVTLWGRIRAIEPHEFGWRAEMDFSPLTPWSPALFEPAHLLDPTDLV